jgi:hypothetical protein
MGDGELVRYEYAGLGFELVAFGDPDFKGEVDGYALSEYNVAISCIATHPSLDYSAAESIRMGIGMFVFRKLVVRGDRAIILYDLHHVLDASPVGETT